nr:hypothetical protein [Heyndrickxia oleronia]
MLNSPPQTSATGKVNCTVLVMRTENSDGTTVIHQLAIGYTGTMYIRSNATNVPGHWFDWRKVITGNEPSPVAVVLNAGWTYHATPSNIPTYTKDPLNTVYLTGIVLRASGAGSTIATLPAGYRPSRETRIYGNGDSELSITTDGRIFCSDGRIGQQIAIHISFKATN